jgi:hypothetical protein
MAMKDEENTANTVPCSLMLTDEKIYVCHDEQDNALIRQLDSVKLEYVAKLLVDPDCHYYCVLVRHCSSAEHTRSELCFSFQSIENGSHGSKTWIFYFLFTKEMIRFVKTLQTALSKTYQVRIDIDRLSDPSFQRECERTSKRLLRSYRPLTLAV